MSTNYVNQKSHPLYPTELHAEHRSYACAEPKTPTQAPALIGYARVSTDEQNLDLQLDALARAGCSHTFQDQGISGGRAARPGLNDALSTLRPGDVLVVWRLDRLGRSLIHLLSIISDLETNGIGFRSLMESIDTKSPSGRFTFHMLAALAEFERSLISERTRAGLAAARERGVHIGRPAKLTPEKQESALQDIRNGLPLAEVARSYGIHTRTLYRMIERSRHILRERRNADEK